MESRALRLTLARWRDVWRRFSGRGTYPHELAFVLLAPVRSLIFSPRALVRRLELQPHFRVLEVGPGPGFFSVEVAKALPRGRLHLLDLQRPMLAKARARLRRARISNAGFTQASAAALPFRSATFDVVFLVAVLGEVPDARACLSSIARVLRPGGLLSVTELPGDPDAVTEAELRALAEQSGLAPAGLHPLRGGFTANFRRAG